MGWIELSGSLTASVVPDIKDRCPLSLTVCVLHSWLISIPPIAWCFLLVLRFRMVGGFRWADFGGRISIVFKYIMVGGFASEVVRFYS